MINQDEGGDIRYKKQRYFYKGYISIYFVFSQIYVIVATIHLLPIYVFLTSYLCCAVLKVMIILAIFTGVLHFSFCCCFSLLALSHFMTNKTAEILQRLQLHRAGVEVEWLWLLVLTKNQNDS